jgi:hypothetical protein
MLFSSVRLCGLVSEFLATDPEVLVRFPALPDFQRSSYLELSPLILVSITEELLDRRNSGSGLESRDYDRSGSATLTTRHSSIWKSCN